MTLFPVVILAGGLGTRMHPYTKTLPKSLLLIEDRPFIDYQLEWLKSQGIEKVILLTGHLGASIQDYVGNGERYGLRVDYYNEGDNLKGTAGAIEAALAFLPQFFFVLYGDSYLSVDFAAVQQHFNQCKARALMTICRNHNPHHRNNVDFNGEKILHYDKFPKEQYAYLDYGLLLFNKDIYSPYTGDSKDLSIYIQQAVKQNTLAHFVVEQPFYEVGSIEGMHQFRDFIHESKLYHRLS